MRRSKPSRVSIPDRPTWWCFASSAASTSSRSRSCSTSRKRRCFAIGERPGRGWREKSNVDSARWQRVQELFHDAVDLPPSERRPFLQKACGGDETLLEEVLSFIEED